MGGGKTGKELTRRLTFGSSTRTWSKHEMGARKMIAFISSKKGTQAAAKWRAHQNRTESRSEIPPVFVPRYPKEPLVRNTSDQQEGTNFLPWNDDRQHRKYASRC